MTYSIAARCADTGQLGVAVQSHFFGVGRIVPWVVGGVGAVATQAQAELAYGDDGIVRLRAGEAPADALAAMLEADDRSAHRQVGIVDRDGRVAAHTGANCIAEASHVLGDGFTTQANMMLRGGVAERMAEVFSVSRGPLWQRLLGALDAAEATGGDIRGQQSAALVVVHPETTGPARSDRLVDVRVDDHSEPLGELRRLAALGMSYAEFSHAGGLGAVGDVEAAIEVSESVRARHPDHREFAFWRAQMLAGAGRHDEACAAIAMVFDVDEGERWRELLRRLPATGRVSDEVVDLLLE
jgi:uncharacterized Ntn-hydrolase superfamily protein